MIEHIKAKQQETVAYYFFSSDLERRRDPMIAVWSWIYHLAFMNASVLDIVNKKWGSGVEAVIIKLFREGIRRVPNCTLVVDGLDECEPSSSCLSVTEYFLRD